MANITKIIGTVKIKLVAPAVNGPNQGEDVEINAVWDSSLNGYKLMTLGSASSGSSTPTDFTFQDGASYTFQDGTSYTFQA